MKNSTALFVANTDTPDAVIAAAADDAGQQNMHLAIALQATMPTLPISTYGALPYGAVEVPDHWLDMLHAAQDKLRTRTDEVEAILARAGTSGDVRGLLVPKAELAAGIARSARTADVAHFAANLRDDFPTFQELLHGVLFQSPIGAALNTGPAPSNKQILLAWDNSLAAARAVHAALPLITSSAEVEVACFEPSAFDETGAELEPGREVAAWLSHHGCTVNVAQLATGGKEIGPCILDRAADIGADLVVAGAYGHSRMRQAVFGGTSRILIEQAKTPVFLAH